MHGRVVETGSLVDVDVQSVAALHLQRGLHAGVGEDGCGGVALVFLAVASDDVLDARERSNLVFILLRVVVSWNPVCGMVSCHGKLCVLLLYHEVVELLLLRKFVAQSHSIVVYAEADSDVPLGLWLVEVHLHLVIVVAYGSRFSPYRAPRLVEACNLVACLLEAVHEVGLVHAL